MGGATAARADAGAGYGLLAEFETVDCRAGRGREVRDAGFTKWDVHAPFPVHGLDDAMGIRPTCLPWVVLGGGLTGRPAASSCSRG